MSMRTPINRRAFVQQLGGLALASGLPLATLAEPLAGKPKFKLGYASITWGPNFEQALQDIKSLGFKAVQISGVTFNAFKEKPEALIELAKASGLKIPISSGGNLRIEPDAKMAAWDSVWATAKTHAKLPGAKLLQVTNGSRPKDRKPTPEELKTLAGQMNEMGRRAKGELNLDLVYHNHMNQLGETPEEVDTILQACDPRYVSFLLDIAHYQWGGGDPVRALEQYKALIKVVHLKDLGPLPGGDAKALQFMELGQGTLNLTEIFAKMDSIGFRGWAIIEIDAVPKGSGRTPLQCAELCKTYLANQVGFKIG
jgi:inosose dehydratase